MFKTLEKASDIRLSNWYQFRQQLETSSSALDDTANYFKNVPKVKVYTDPYDQTTWPTAWELINENEYCPFNLTLAVCYTLQLTTYYQNYSPLIKIALDKTNKTVYYMLFIDDKVFGFDATGWISANNLPTTLKYLKIYNMPPLH